MNSRERVLNAINHKECDRVPIDLGGMRSTGISVIAYNNLLKYLKINKTPRMYDFIQQLAYPDNEILDLFKIDAIDASQAFLTSDDSWIKWNVNSELKSYIPYYLNIEKDKNDTVLLKDKNGFVYGTKPKNSLYVNQTFYVYQNLDKIPDIIKDEDLKKSMWKLPTTPYHLDIFDEKDFSIFSTGLKEQYENTDRAVILASGCNFFEGGTRIRGMENFLCDIYLDEKGTLRLLDKLVEKYLIFLDRIISKNKDCIDILMFGGDDLGSQNAPFIPRHVFKKIFTPYYKKIWDFVHDNSSCKVFLHSCGSIFELIPELIEAGLDILNPVQTMAENMDPISLKKEFGKDITFWGAGVNTRDILPFKSPKEVEEDVKKRIEIFSKNGGFVFAPIHNILADVPPENIIAAYRAAYVWGNRQGDRDLSEC